jgi:competence protein ComEA
MRSRKSSTQQVAAVARRRLELLSAELAEIRRDQVDPRDPMVRDGSGELSTAVSGALDPSTPEATARGRHARRSVGPGALVAGWVHDRLPPTLQGRVQLGSSHLTLVALTVAAALAVTAWVVVRADGSQTTVPMARVAAAAAAGSEISSALVSLPSAGVGSASETPSTGSTIVIDVTGKVRHPGIATLPIGSRVVDAVEAAGGARTGVSLRTLNLARVLVDGEQIVVGIPGPAGVAASAASAPGAGPSGSVPLVNLNTADQTALESLPGVGPVTAQAILKWRSENGSFTAVDELLEVSGIGDATLAEIAPFVTL